MTLFKVGDTVKIVRKVITRHREGMQNAGLYTHAWENGWNAAEMDQYVNNGVVYTIKRISPSGIYFVEEPRYGWPTLALEHTRKAKKKIM